MEGERLNLIPEHIQAYVDHAIDTARAIAQNADPVASVVIVGNPEGIMVFPFELEGDDHHLLKAGVIRHFAGEMDATHVFMVSEAWMFHESAKENKRDVIMFQLETHIGIWFAAVDIAAHDFQHPKARNFETPVFEFGTSGALNSLLPKHKGTTQ